LRVERVEVVERERVPMFCSCCRSSWLTVQSAASRALACVSWLSIARFSTQRSR
jgi:hypothetical protein